MLQPLFTLPPIAPARTCQYISGDPRLHFDNDGNVPMCGRPAIEGSSYCEEHHHRCIRNKADEAFDEVLGLMRVKTMNWSVLAAAQPLDATAARVVSRSEDSPDEDLENAPWFQSHIFWSLAPPASLERHPGFEGTRKGRLTAVGLDRCAGTGAKKKKRIVVRCDCGAYEHRQIQWVEKKPDHQDQCRRCIHEHRMLKEYEVLGGLPIEEFVENVAPKRIWITMKPGRKHGSWSSTPGLNGIPYVLEEVSNDRMATEED